VCRESFFTHRGFFHSALFLALFSLTAAVIVARKRPGIVLHWRCWDLGRGHSHRY
jgi:hypothetical protein